MYISSSDRLECFHCSLKQQKYIYWFVVQQGVSKSEDFYFHVQIGRESMSKKIIKYWVINNDKNDECL
ncbi:hypothetical protein COJ77_14770 [Bacillus cereus]|nr:hypothetical protein COJ77_14770 [Bacillus cereus]